MVQAYFLCGGVQIKHEIHEYAIMGKWYCFIDKLLV